MKNYISRNCRIDENGNVIIDITEKIGERYKQTNLGVIINFKNMTIQSWEGEFLVRNKIEDIFVDEIKE